jgi:transposase InsO family protein
MGHPRPRPSAEGRSFAVGSLRCCSRWVDWYNHRRLLEPIGHVPPAEAEARYYDNLQDTALAA